MLTGTPGEAAGNIPPPFEQDNQGRANHALETLPQATGDSLSDRSMGAGPTHPSLMQLSLLLMPCLAVSVTQTCGLTSILALVLHSDGFTPLQPFPLLALTTTHFHRICFANLYFSGCLQAAVSCPWPLTHIFISAATASAERIIPVP